MSVSYTHLDVYKRQVLGAIAAATAPAATIMVIKQYRAKGPVTETLRSVVAIDDATALSAFGIAVAVAQTLTSTADVSLVLSLSLIHILHEQEEKFFEFVTSRPESTVEEWIQLLSCLLYTSRCV